MAVVENTDGSDLGMNVGSTSRNLDAGAVPDSHGAGEDLEHHPPPPQKGHLGVVRIHPATSFHMKVQQFPPPQPPQPPQPAGTHGLDHTALVAQRSNGGNGSMGEEGFKRDIRDLEELLSKLNPMAEEFVPPSIANHGSSGGTIPGFYSNGFGMISGFPNGNGVRRKKSSYGHGQGNHRMNIRTSMAQREEIIRRTVYVSDIDQQVTEEELAALFVNCGQVVDCRVCGDTNSVLRFAFIEFTDEEGARAALSLTGTMLGFYPVRVLPSKTAIAPVDPKFLPRSEDEREMCSRTIYCTNIDKKVTQSDVKLFFETICGQVYRLRLLGDYHHATRIAFVEFVRREREREREREMEGGYCNDFHAGNNGHHSNGSDAGDTAGKIISCKAAVVYGPEEPFMIEEVQVDPPQRMEVRVKILFTSICHTDLSAWIGQNQLQRVYPRILGHEAAGVVESVGDGVEELREGDHVIPIFNGECGVCGHCKSGKTNMCGEFRIDPFRSVMRRDGRTRFSVAGGGGERRPVYHFINTSTFAEYTVMDSACVVKIDPAAPLHRMCLLSCGITTGVGAAWNTANVQEGSKVAIFGLGAVGLAAAEGARLRGASRIIGVDINPDKFVKGREMGITDFVDPMDGNKPVHEVIREMTKGGVDYSFECAGNLDVLREAFLSTHDGWGLTVILGIHPTPRLLPLHPMELFDGRRLVGCVFGGFKGKSQLPDLVHKCMHGEIKINLEGFITHKMPFAKINEAFQLLKQGKSLRCLLTL